MSPDRWKTLEPLLDAILELTPERRVAFVNDTCAGNAVLRADLMELLNELTEHDPLLDHPAAERFSALLEETPVSIPRMLDDRYRIERELGRGGMATVYLAQDLRHARQVAIKVLRPEVAASLGAERFLAEIRVTAQFQHPHILPLHDSGSVDGFLFFVMPYVEGESLRSRLERERQLSVDDAVRITCEVASALEAAHHRGVVHRDIKPENILLREGTALVADFGIALAMSEASPRVTNPGLALGTPQYMSPEQATGAGAIDSRADVYALGTMCYEMLAGEAPFTGTSATAIIAKRAAAPAPSVRILRAAIPPAIETVVSRALAREPADRYRTAGAFADALNKAHVDGAAAGGPGSTRGLPLVVRPLVGAALIALVISGAAIIAKAGNRTNSAPATEGTSRIAVLPFAVAGNDTSNSYFAAGMAEFLGTALAQIPGIGVVPSRSTGTTSGGQSDAEFKALGQRLAVATLLYGSVLRAGDQLQVVIGLVSAQSGGTVWSNTYRRGIQRATDLFTLQDDIVNDIASQLRVALAGTGPVAPSHPRTEDLVALDLYLQGRFFLDKRTPGLQKAREYFEHAIARDSNLAQAHAGLSEVYLSYGNGNMGDYRPRQYYPMAREAALRAVALDSTSADAHALLGAVKLLYEFDWSGAQKELSLALRLDDKNTNARTWATILLEFQGRFEDAMRESRAAMDGDPQSMYANIEYGRAAIFGRQYERAKNQFRRVLERDSLSFRAHLLLGEALGLTGQYDSAEVELQAARRLAPNSSRVTAFLAHMYGRAGRQRESMRELGVLHQRARNAYVPAFDFAVAYAGLGRVDKTFEWLDKSFADRSLRPYLMDPTFDSIRADPRYIRLVARLNLPVPGAKR